MINQDQYINHEVRIQMIEKAAQCVDFKLGDMNKKIESNSKFILALIVVSIITPILLHFF